MENKVEIIAEIGINHGGSLAVALKMIDAVKKTGADTVKFQFVDPDFYEKGTELHKIFTDVYLNHAEHILLKQRADLLGLNYLCTPSDVKMARILIDEVGVDRIKVASDSAKDPKLALFLKENSIPYLISTGYIESANLKVWAKKHNPKYATILHCVTKYPTPPMKADIKNITKMCNTLPNTIGYSDHTEGIYAPLLAIGAGAKIIEKHFMIDKNSIDAPVSLMPYDFEKMVSLIRQTEEYL